MWINKAKRNTSEIFVIYLVPGPVKDRAWGRFSFTELRGGEKAAADTGKAVGRGGASSITEVLSAGMEVPTANTGVGRRRSDYQFRLRHLVGFARSTHCIVDCRNSLSFCASLKLFEERWLLQGVLIFGLGKFGPKKPIIIAIPYNSSAQKAH